MSNLAKISEIMARKDIKLQEKIKIINELKNEHTI
jgi:hypothetical protein